MEYTTTEAQISSQVNCTCEHIWHNHARGNSINADSLLKAVREKLFKPNDPNLKAHVDIWIAEFSTRTSSYRTFNKEKGLGAGGRNAESLGHISYL